MSQATQDHRGGGLHHRGVDPAQRPEARPHVGHDAQVRAPARRLGGVGNEQRRPAEGRRHHPHQAIEDPLAADCLEPLRAAAESGGAAAAEDRAPHAAAQ